VIAASCNFQDFISIYSRNTFLGLKGGDSLMESGLKHFIRNNMEKKFRIDEEKEG